MTSPFAPFKHRVFAAFWTGAFVSNIGTWMETVGIGIYVTNATHRSGWTGLVAAAGIRHVTGDVLIDDRLFDRAESSGSGPSHVTPITINDNVVDLVFEPTEVGQPARVTSRPQTAAIQIDWSEVAVF